MSGGSTDASDESGKPFYTFGVVVSRQLGEQLGSVKNLLSKEELDLFLQGFVDGTKDQVPNQNELFAKYGPKIDEILGGRSKNVLENEKKKGSDFAAKYLLSHPRAIRTPSGLIYNEILAGIGAQVLSFATVPFPINALTITTLLIFPYSQQQLPA